MNSAKTQLEIRKLRYAKEAYENHDCTGKGCERCKNAETSANEALAALPQWLVNTTKIIVFIIYPFQYAIWLIKYAFWLLRKMYDKLFHIPQEGSK